MNRKLVKTLEYPGGGLFLDMGNGVDGVACPNSIGSKQLAG